MPERLADGSVIMPREDFIRLTTVAFENQPPHVPTLGQRAANVSHVAAVCGIIGSSVVGVTWAWSRFIDWKDERHQERVRVMAYQQQVHEQTITEIINNASPTHRATPTLESP